MQIKVGTKLENEFEEFEIIKENHEGFKIRTTSGKNDGGAEWIEKYKLIRLITDGDVSVVGTKWNSLIERMGNGA